MLDNLVTEMELPESSLSLIPNYSQDGKNTITSYSVSIYEPDYPFSPNAKKDPSRNSTVLNIKEKGSKLELTIGSGLFDVVGRPENAEVKESSLARDGVKVTLSNDSAELTDYIKRLTVRRLASYEPKADSFGCCDLFTACSDAGRCLHVNKLYSKACSYRRNLEAGRIFYGKNKNI